ncbi:hypothetical protein [Pseudidiomarina terrestris]|uniref:hypothetical protein n=1 Tax=Pseudidiomarina terrestris TaxID=2820060 RepID=UPI00264CDA89|nr:MULTISPECIES: hypothetical protein [unclassified Pseudidiomarina]MDN7134574.1 hypothetical protein [Pseudidiomarina sp. 1ASP75-5]MEA3587640.1 hypothetical protein [Pseudidiomarina sp. 1APP75-27a]
MHTPKEVRQAIIAIWLTIFISAVIELANYWTGNISVNDFVTLALFFCILGLFPYKIAKGSNRARWVYCTLAVLSVTLSLGGVFESTTTIDWIGTVVIIPLDIFTVIKLFQADASNWFESRSKAQPSHSV